MNFVFPVPDECAQFAAPQHEESLHNLGEVGLERVHFGNTALQVQLHFSCAFAHAGDIA